MKSFILICLSISLPFLVFENHPGLAQNKKQLAKKMESSLISDDVRDSISHGQWKKVEESLKPLIGSVEKTSEPVMYWYGVSLFEQQKYSASIGPLTGAFKKKPQSVATARYLARAGFRTRSTKTIEDVLEKFPQDEVILNALGRRYFSQFLQLFSKKREADNSLAYENLSRSIRAFRKSIAANENFVDAHKRLALALHWADDESHAVRELLIADRLGALGFDSYSLLGKCYSALGDHERAETAYAAALKTNPKNWERLEWERAMALRKAGNHAEAVEILREIFRRDHAHKRVRFELGKAAYDSGDYSLALFAFNQAFQVDNSLDALVWSAKCSYDLGQDKLALKIIGRAFETRKKNTAQGNEPYYPHFWHFVKGQILFQQKDYRNAVTHLEKALEDWKSNMEYASWTVLAFKRLNDPYGLVRVAKYVGKNGHPQEALKLVDGVRKGWFFPPSKDHRGKRYRGGLSWYMFRAVAEIYESQNQYRSAFIMNQQGGINSKQDVRNSAGWIAFRAGEIQEAENIFKVYLEREKTEKYRQFSHHGLAFIAIHNGNAEEARRHARKLVTKRLSYFKETLLKRADLLAGDTSVVEKFDTLDLLGVYGDWFSGSGLARGLFVKGLFPKSPLEKTIPGLQAKDVILQVGSQKLINEAGLVALRKLPVPSKPVTVLVRRGRRYFEVKVDFNQVRELLQTSLVKKETKQ